MVALLRLKATFEAWKSNFRGLSWTFWPKYENMGSRLAKEWHVKTAPPCEEHRATSKDLRVTVHETQHGTAENARARTTLVSVSCACTLRIWSWRVLKRENYFFSGSDGGLSRGVWTGHSLVSPQVQRWPCGYSPSIQSRSLLDVPCHCSFT